MTSKNAYETYTDEDGNTWDDEGNVSRRGRPPGLGGTSKYRKYPQISRPARPAPPSPNAEQLAVLDEFLANRGSNFVQSIRDQVARGRPLSEKQKDVIRQILERSPLHSKAEMFRGASLRSKVIRLAYTNPELRPHLLPLVR